MGEKITQVWSKGQIPSNSCALRDSCFCAYMVPHVYVFLYVWITQANFFEKNTLIDRDFDNIRHEPRFQALIQ